MTKIVTSKANLEIFKENEQRLSNKVSQIKDEKKAVLNSLTTIEKQFKKTKTGLAISGSLGTIILFCLLICLFLLKRKKQRTCPTCKPAPDG